jgi:hypothetical protein
MPRASGVCGTPPVRSPGAIPCGCRGIMGILASCSGGPRASLGGMAASGACQASFTFCTSRSACAFTSPYLIALPSLGRLSFSVSTTLVALMCPLILSVLLPIVVPLICVLWWLHVWSPRVVVWPRRRTGPTVAGPRTMPARPVLIRVGR